MLRRRLRHSTHPAHPSNPTRLKRLDHELIQPNFIHLQEALSGLALDERQVADLSKALGIMARSGGKVRPGLTWGGETDSGVSECHVGALGRPGLLASLQTRAVQMKQRFPLWNWGCVPK